MAQKSILITGCSSGIGYAAAVGLRADGWRVFAACRKPEDCARLQSEGFDSPLIDYTDAQTIAAGLAEVLEATGGTLDALFNNGAHGTPGAVEDLPTEALRQIFEANFFGWHELTRAVIPVMRAQGHGRIVQCSSVLGFVTLPWRGAYNATKFALEGLTDTLRIELKGSGIHVVLIEPGPVTSKIRQNSDAAFRTLDRLEGLGAARSLRGHADQAALCGSRPGPLRIAARGRGEKAAPRADQQPPAAALLRHHADLSHGRPEASFADPRA